MDDTPTKQTVQRAHERSPMLMGSVLVFGHGVKHLFNASIFVVLPELQIHFGLSNLAIGALSTIRTVGGGLSNLPAGYLSDRLSSHWARILALSLATVGIFHLLMGSVSAYWLLVLTATIANVGVTFWHPPAIAALSQMFARRRGFAIAMHGTGGSVGEALGPIAVGALLGVVLWRTVLQVSVVPALATGALAWLALRGFQAESPSPTSFRAYLTAVLRLLRSPVLVNILVITGGFVSVQAIVMTFLPIYLRVELGYSALTMSAFLSAANVVGVVSAPVMGFLSDRFSRKVVILPSMVLLGAAALAVPIAESGIPLLLAVLAMGAFMFPLMSIFLAAALDVAGGDVPATTVSLVFGAATVVSGVTPAVAGVLADEYGVLAVFLLAGGIGLVTAVFTAFRSLSR